MIIRILVYLVNPNKYSVLFNGLTNGERGQKEGPKIFSEVSDWRGIL